MAVEIERKFLVQDDAWRVAAAGTLLRQGYLSTDRDRVVRVRLAGEQGTLTIKSRTVGLVRPEYEYGIPAADARELLDLCLQPLIEKIRYRILHGGHVWEVDEFLGANAGLVVAECELDSPDEPLELPGWVGREVTGDPRYGNSNLIAHPFTAW